MRRAMTSFAAAVPDNDISLRFQYAQETHQKLFMDDACPVCYGTLGSAVAVCGKGHAVCSKCNAAWASSCAVCRDEDIQMLALTDDDADVAFDGEMRVCAAMVPAQPERLAGPCAEALARYGAASSGTLDAVMLVLERAAAPAQTARALYVLIDVSASMDDVLPLIGFRALLAECAARAVTLCVVTFGSSATTVFGPARVAASDFIPPMRTDGSTAMHLGLHHVRELIEAEASKAAAEGFPEVRIVTDGECDDRAAAIGEMRALARVASVFLVATGAYVFENCSELLANDTTKFEFVAPEDAHAALAPTGATRVAVQGGAASRMYCNGNVTAPCDGVHHVFSGAPVAFTGDVGYAALSPRRDLTLDYEIRTFLLASTALAYVKAATFDTANDGMRRARKLARARRVLCTYGTFPEIVAVIDAGIASIRTGREASNSLARLATCAARAVSQAP